jgi:hypothetical protein
MAKVVSERPVWATIIPLLPSACALSQSAWRTGVCWLLALAGAVLYYAITPVERPYSAHPFWLMWGVSLAVITGIVLSHLAAGLTARLTLVLLVLCVNVSPHPRFCNPVRCVKDLIALWHGQPQVDAPLGYTHPYGIRFAGDDILFPWEDYRSLLDYLRGHTAPDVRVANALPAVAVDGPVGRQSAFPAESATWLFIMRPGEEPDFAEALQRALNSVVVWAPGQTGKYSLQRFPLLVRTIRTWYEPEAKFGMLEVWRRRPQPSDVADSR